MGSSAEAVERLRPPGGYNPDGVRLLRLVGLTLSLLGALGCPTDRAPKAEAPAAARHPVPEAGGAVELEVGPGAPAEIVVESPGGEFLQIAASQAETDLTLELIGPGGERETIDEGSHPTLSEVAAWVTGEPGPWVLRLTTPAPGSARLEVEERRPASPRDASRVRALRLTSRALFAGETDTADGLRTAAALLEETLPLWLEAGDAAERARALNRRGLCAQALDREDEALEWYRRSEGAWEAAGDPLEVTRVRYNRGTILRERGRLDVAAALFEDALERCRDLAGCGLEYRILSSLGLTLCEAGEPEAGRARVEEARRLARDSASRPAEALAANNVGICLRAAGDLDGAAAAYIDAATLAREVGRTSLLAAALGHLGLVRQLQGDLQAALDHSLEALEFRRALGSPLDTADTLANLGTLYLDLGRLDRAQASYREMLDLARQAGDARRQGWAIRNLGWIRLLEGEPARGLELFVAAREHSDPALDPRGWAATVHAEGVARRRSGDAAPARRTLEEAIDAARSAGDPAREAAAGVELAAALLDLGEIDEARSRARSASELAIRVGQRGIQAAAASRTADVERAAGRPEHALAALDEAIGLHERLRETVFDPGLRATFLAERRRDYESRVAVLLELAARDADPARVVEALLTAERGKARSLADRLHERHLELPVPPELARRRGALDAHWSRLQARLVAAETGVLGTGVLGTGVIEKGVIEKGVLGTSADPESLRAQLASLEIDRERLEAEIRSRAPGGELLNPTPPTLGEIQGALASGTLLLDYLVGDEASFLFAVTRDEVAVHTIPAGADELGARVETVRRALATPDRRRLAAALPVARILFDELVEPAGELLATAERLVVVPDRALHALPFDVLPTRPVAAWAPGTEPWLLRRWALTTAPSATVLARLSEAQPNRERELDLLVLADPVYAGEDAADDASRGPLRPEEPARGLPRLAASADEARAIAGVFRAPRVALHLRGDATESRLDPDGPVSRTRYLHIAAHGLLDEDRPELQGLALTADPEHGSDGLLQIHEILRIPLDADLAVLSACSTGLGRDVRGEGLVGLTQAFLAAGARGVVVSLWPVTDRSTAELMVGLYGGLSRGLAAPEALREAKLALAGRGGPYAHPHHWASFIVVAGTPAGGPSVPSVTNDTNATGAERRPAPAGR